LPVRVLEDPDFGTFVSGACAARGISPNRLVFEIAERDIHDTASITSAIDRMVEIGATISVDDFGAGHATFERLRWGNVEQLKLDSEAIQHAVERPRDRAILKSILGLTAELGYTVVAEGVESEQQLELLRSLGCPLVQGHLFAAAMPLLDVVDFVAQRRVRVG
jgi:EAL domain-containing protein (putative c-di-GMP-specific phosphodiesterase class I)